MRAWRWASWTKTKTWQRFSLHMDEQTIVSRSDIPKVISEDDVGFHLSGLSECFITKHFHGLLLMLLMPGCSWGMFFVLYTSAITSWWGGASFCRGQKRGPLGRDCVTWGFPLSPGFEDVWWFSGFPNDVHKNTHYTSFEDRKSWYGWRMQYMITVVFVNETPCSNFAA